jgi:hypothetical protein
MRFRTVLIVALAALGAAAAVADGAARTGVLGGRLAGFPTKALLPAVRAVNTRGVIAAIAQPSASGAYRLFVSPGDYLVIGSAASPKGREFEAFSVPVAARSRKRTNVRTRVKSVKTLSADIAVVRPLANAIVTVGSVPVFLSNPGLAVGVEYQDHVVNLLFNLCTSQGTLFVDSSPEGVAAINQERALAAAGRLTTPFNYRPLKPEFRITGEADVFTSGPPPNNIGIKVKFRATNLRSGRILLDNIWAELTPSAPHVTSPEIQATVDLAVERFAHAACGNGAL